MGIFIPPHTLKNLKLYSYSSEDHSVISKLILKQWWVNFEKLFPLWMAPNVITLSGLGFIVINLLVVFYYSPSLQEEFPRWCYFFFAFGLFMYQTFDGCDGQHARRTGQSGPLGELFDHSIDAINTTLGCFVYAATFRMGYSYMFLISQFFTVANFYASTWEEYHTHTLFLSHFSGPVEGILMICTVYLITGFFGPDIWNSKIFSLDLLSLGGPQAYEINASIINIALGVPSMYFNIATTMENVKKYYLKENDENRKLLSSATEEKRENNVIRHAYLGIVPFFAYYASVAALVYLYPTSLTHNGLALVLANGCVIAFSVGRIITAHLTKQSFPYINAPLFAPTIQIVLSYVLINVYGIPEETVVNSLTWLSLGLCLGVHAMFVTEIIYEITTYLDIYTLSIKHKKA